MPNRSTLTILVSAALWLSGFVLVACAADRDNRIAEDAHILVQNGLERRYVVRVPSALARGAVKMPLVLVLHGGGGNAAISEYMTGFTEKAEKEGFIVVYPEGSGRIKGQLLTWNAGHCCGYAMTHQVNDVEFISTLIDRLIKDYPIDPQRVYATGMSNGGMMAHRLGIELSHKIAAIAPVVATLFGDEKKPAQPVSAIMFNGMRDQAVPYLGGPPGGRFPGAWDGTPAKPALAQATFWANANHCTDKPEQIDKGLYTVWKVRCPGGHAVIQIMIKDYGHAWPGGKKGSHLGDEPSPSPVGTDVIWAFFKDHRKTN